jgi:hypothetical protein
MVFAGMLAGAVFGQSGRVGWDGTWIGGWDNNAGVQLTFVGDKLISFYWLDDYKNILRVAATPAGDGKSFAWATGEATLTRDPGGGVLLLVRERGGKEVPVRLRRE